MPFLRHSHLLFEFHGNSDALRFVYGRYRQPTAVPPGISLYEPSNENDKDRDPGDSDESDR